MFVIYNKEIQKVPIKVWLEKEEDIEPGCREQALHLASLPFAKKWICLMPDTHDGYGMPIGGVIATDSVVIPNAVGVDIGCGMKFIQTNIPAYMLREQVNSDKTILQLIIEAIMISIPLGFTRHKEKQPCDLLDMAKDVINGPNKLLSELEAGYYQIGTLGGGNHFIELQEDDEGYLAIMVHTGSRNFGYKICNYFNEEARELNARWYSSVPLDYDLAFLPDDSNEGALYIKWMGLAIEFAKENRNVIMKRVKEILALHVSKYLNLETLWLMEVDCNHNYAKIETHYGEVVWVHRKGAIRVREEELGIIPGAMGSYSYIVKGSGNEESFQSCSHGAGRRMSRSHARENYQVQDVLNDLDTRGIVLGTEYINNIADECRWAYKNIDTVLENEKDLVTPIKRLRTIGVVKG